MKSVLVIEEDRLLRSSLVQWLHNAGWSVIEAEEGATGLALALERKPTLILCDLLAPRYNGFQLCRFLRTYQDKLPGSRIVVMTSGGYGVDRETALQSGADNWIVKPVLQADLLQLLETFEHPPEETPVPRLPERDTAIHEAPPPPPNLVPDGQALVRFWGVRGSIATPGHGTLVYGGNTSCIELRADGQIIILDAGTGIRGLGLRLAEEFKDVPLAMTLLISHTHWDHIQGLPFFDPAYNPRNRLRILGYEGARAGLLAALSGQMESPYFPVGWRQLPSYIVLQELKQPHFKIGPISVESIYLNHPGICVGYRLETSAGKIAYLPDNEPFQRYKFHAAAADPVGQTEILEFARRMDEKLISFIRGVDILIIDSQYDANEYETRAGWGHGCIDDVVALALKARVKRLFLFHHDPAHDDAKVTAMTAWAKQFVGALGESLQVEAAREGLEITLRNAS